MKWVVTTRLAPVQEGPDQRHGGAHLAQRDGMDPDGAGQGLAVGPNRSARCWP